MALCRLETSIGAILMDRRVRPHGQPPREETHARQNTHTHGLSKEHARLKQG